MWQQQMIIINLNDGSNLIPNHQIEVVFFKSKFWKYIFWLIKVKNWPKKKKEYKKGLKFQISKSS